MSDSRYDYVRLINNEWFAIDTSYAPLPKVWYRDDGQGIGSTGVDVVYGNHHTYSGWPTKQAAMEAMNGPTNA